MPGARKLSWDSTYKEAWAEAVAQWGWKGDEDSLRTEGECPRCRHPMSREITRGPVIQQQPAKDVAALEVLEASRDRAAEAPVVRVVVACNCVETHKGGPAGESGCGARATQTLALTGDNEIQPIAWGPVTPDDVAWDRRARQEDSEALTGLRAAATAWGAQISAFTGILGIVALIKGRENISEIEPGFQYWVGGALLAAVLAAVAAIVYAALAADGSPRWMWLVGAEAKRNQRSERAVTARQLLISRITAVLIVPFLAAAVAITWFGPEKDEDPAPVKVLAVSATGAVTCGDLATGAGTALALKSGSGQPLTLKDGDIRSLSVVSACPGDEEE